MAHVHLTLNQNSLAPATPVEPEEVNERLVNTTGETRGSLLSILAEMEEIMIEGLRAGRIVRFPNGLTFRPIGKSDGSIKIKVEVPDRVERLVNANFRGKWINAENIGKSEGEILALWDSNNPADLIER